MPEDDQIKLIATIAKLEEKLVNIEKAIAEIKDDIKATIKDHEIRIRRLEMWGAIAIGVSYAAQFYFNFIK